LRAAIDLASNLTPAGLEAFARRESQKPWRLRLAGTLSTLRANLSLESAACRHAILLAVCVAAGDAVARAVSLQRAYWTPMTIASSLKPDFTATFSRGALRFMGTFGGLLAATGLLHFVARRRHAQVALCGVMMFAMRCFGAANFGIFTGAGTALVVILLALTGVHPAAVITARGVNTIAGGSIALLAYSLWPTWERSHLSETIAGMLETYRDYFHLLRMAYLHPDRSYAAELDRTRLSGRLARTNLEAGVDLAIAEPGTTAETINSLTAVLASSHRLTHALMALEAGLSTSQPSLPAKRFRYLLMPWSKLSRLSFARCAALRSGAMSCRTSVRSNESWRNPETPSRNATPWSTSRLTALRTAWTRWRRNYCAGSGPGDSTPLRGSFDLLFHNLLDPSERSLFFFLGWTRAEIQNL
jgi:uncharacterized membrane protein YccC